MPGALRSISSYAVFCFASNIFHTFLTILHIQSLPLIQSFLFLILAIGGLFIGFGSRYAGGCTSGHAISGLSSLQIPSLIAVIGFFIGGLLMTHILFPLIF